MTNVRHPARYTPSVVEVAADVLKRYGAIDTIDVFAGTCERIVALHDHGWNGDIYANEIQRRWAMQAPASVHVTIGDAERLPYESNRFSSAFTSVVYGNRMSDHHRAKDGSRRNTYTHAYGEELDVENTGRMQFTGKRQSSLQYATKHKRCYIELRRVLADGAIFVLNVSNHIRKGSVVRTTLWHVLALKSLGFEVIEWHRIETPRLRYGANGEKRVKYENVVVFRLNKDAS